MKFLGNRVRGAVKASGIHLVVSLGVATLAALLVFGLWYPPPYDQLAGGRGLLVLVLAVDVVCGPLLTLIVFSPFKARAELIRDLGVIAALQFAALCYGIFSVMEARPVWLAFEGNRFRVVSVPDVMKEDIARAPPNLRALSLTGPRLLGVRLVKDDDPEFRRSIELAIEGQHPAFRPDRWVPYREQTTQVAQAAKPVKELYERCLECRGPLDKAVREASLDIDQLGYLPLIGRTSADWTVLVDLANGAPRAFAEVDAW